MARQREGVVDGRKHQMAACNGVAYVIQAWIDRQPCQGSSKKDRPEPARVQSDQMVAGHRFTGRTRTCGDEQRGPRSGQSGGSRHALTRKRRWTGVPERSTCGIRLVPYRIMWLIDGPRLILHRTSFTTSKTHHDVPSTPPCSNTFSLCQTRNSGDGMSARFGRFERWRPSKR